MPLKVFKNLNETAKLWLGLFMLILMLFGIPALLYLNSKDNEKLLKDNGINTRGIYTGIGGNRGMYHVYSYLVDGKKYVGYLGNAKEPKGIDTLAFINEMYEVRYLPTDPEISQINFLKRVEEKELYGIETKGKIDVIHWIPSGKHWLVRYSYERNGKTIKSKQAYRYWDTSNVKAGRLIKIVYSSFRKGKDLPEKSWIIPGKEPL